MPLRCPGTIQGMPRPLGSSTGAVNGVYHHPWLVLQRGPFILLKTQKIVHNLVPQPTRVQPWVLCAVGAVWHGCCVAWALCAGALSAVLGAVPIRAGPR